MLVSEFVPAVSLKATGKLPAFLSGSAAWLKIVAIANQKIDEFDGEPGVKWNSLLDPIYSLGTISTTNSYDLDDEINKIGDIAKITHIDGSFTEYEVVPPSELRKRVGVCAKVGKTLIFDKAFVATDPQYGGTLTIPAYLHAEHLLNDNDEIPIDNPQWLVSISAAEYNRNDVTKQNQYNNLVGEANNLMTGMKNNNEDSISYLGGSWQCPGASW